MTISLSILVIFGTVTLGVAATCYVLAGLWANDAQRVRRRVEGEFRAAQGGAAKSPLFKDLDEFESGPRSGLPGDAEAAWLRPVTFSAQVRVLLARADLSLTVRQLLLTSLAMGAGFGAAATFVQGPLIGAAAALAGLVAPLLVVRAKATARREALLNKLPNAFELMARVIKAGQSVPQAVQAVADSFDGPVSQEFSNCQKRQSLGQRPDLTFREMAERSGILEMRIFVMAMLIHRQTGGNLSEVLERLAGLIRSRLKLRKQVRSLTAEGRLQGWTLAVLPLIMFGMLMLVNRQYAEVLFDHPPLIVAMFVMMTVGLLWIRKIVNFDA